MVKRLLESGETWLRSVHKKIDAVTVTYSRAADSVAVSATKGKRQAISEDHSGAVIANQVIDFLIDRSELLLDAVLVIPQINDRIVVQNGSVSEEYRVSNGPGGEDCFDFSDRNNKVFRIHTSYIGTVSK